MDTNDDNLVETKTLIDSDQSTPSLAFKEESHKLDLTSSTSMGAVITKSQENGSGVMDDDLEMVKGVKESKNDEKLDGISIGNNDPGDFKQEDRNKSYGVEFRVEGSSSDGKLNSDVSSSIAQRTRNRAVIGKKEEIDVDGGDKGYENDDEDDELSGFNVGDFVWGKVKSHPWWPGRIYDSSNASDFAHKKRKVKSMAALLGKETEDELKGDDSEKTEGKTRSGKSGSKSRKKRRKVSDSDQSTGDDVDGNGSSKDEEQQSGEKPARKKRKTIDKLMVTRSSSRKKKEGSASARSTASEKKDSGVTEDGGKKLKGVKKMEITPHVSINGGSTVEEGYERISPREKKLSKYLSPPYTNILQRQRSSCSQTGSESGLVFSDVARVGERMSKTAGKFTGSPPLVKCSAETFRKSSKQTKADHSASKQEPDSEVNVPMKSVGSVDSVLYDLRSAALDPLFSRKDQSLDSISGFLSSYRSSSYKNGSNYSSYKKALAVDRRRKKKRKRDSSGSEPGSEKKVLNEVVDQQTPKPKPVKEKNARKKEQKSESKSKADHEVGSTSSAAVVTGEAGAKSRDKQPSGSSTGATPESEPLAVIFIKKKLEGMTSMLSQTDGKMSQEVKASLENEVKELLKKVKKMTPAS